MGGVVLFGALLMAMFACEVLDEIRVGEHRGPIYKDKVQRVTF